jgi:hypothetical protein
MQRSELKRKKPMARKAPKKRAAERGGDEEHLAWIRKQPCSGCNARGPNDAHHPTGAGLALKAPDREAVPLCRLCHTQYHDGTGRFEGWSKAEKRAWMALNSAQLQTLLFAEKLRNAR